jgi:hypothetical protein
VDSLAPKDRTPGRRFMVMPRRPVAVLHRAAVATSLPTPTIWEGALSLRAPHPLTCSAAAKNASALRAVEKLRRRQIERLDDLTLRERSRRTLDGAWPTYIFVTKRRPGKS